MRTRLALVVGLLVCSCGVASAQVREDWAARYDGARQGDGARGIAVDKYDTNGNQLWVAHYAGPANGSGASAIVLDSAGNVHVTGSSMGVDYLYDYVTIKYDTNGHELWVARYNGPANDCDFAYAIALDAVGDVYVTGASGGTESTETATIKYDANGKQIWVARSGEAAPFAIAVEAGNVYVTGLATIKYDGDGHELWVARNNGPGIFRANALAVDGSGNAYVTGAIWGAGPPDYTTIKYDTDGNERWVARYNGPGDGYDWAAAIVLDASRNVYVTGQSDGAATSSDYATNQV